MTTATCPVCNGTKRRPVPDHARPYVNVMSSYDPVTDTLGCNNCGVRGMSTRAMGIVRVDPATGLGCHHEYDGRKAGNCYRIYTCRKCKDVYDVDSSD
jgi:hypothetical protein